MARSFTAVTTNYLRLDSQSIVGALSGASEATFGAWVNIRSLAASTTSMNDTIIGGAIVASNIGPSFKLSSTGQIGVGGRASDADATVFAYSAARVSLNSWLHVAAIARPGGRCDFYADGHFAGSAAWTPGSTRYSPIAAVTGIEHIGARGGSTPLTGTQIDGLIAHPVVYRGALRPQEIKLLAAGVSPQEISPSSLVLWFDLTAGSVLTARGFQGRRATVTGSLPVAEDPIGISGRRRSFFAAAVAGPQIRASVAAIGVESASARSFLSLRRASVATSLATRGGRLLARARTARSSVTAAVRSTVAVAGPQIRSSAARIATLSRSSKASIAQRRGSCRASVGSRSSRVSSAGRTARASASTASRATKSLVRLRTAALKVSVAAIAGRKLLTTRVSRGTAATSSRVASAGAGAQVRGSRSLLSPAARGSTLRRLLRQSSSRSSPASGSSRRRIALRVSRVLASVASSVATREAEDAALACCVGTLIGPRRIVTIAGPRRQATIVC